MSSWECTRAASLPIFSRATWGSCRLPAKRRRLRTTEKRVRKGRLRGNKVSKQGQRRYQRSDRREEASPVNSEENAQFGPAERATEVL